VSNSQPIPATDSDWGNLHLAGAIAALIAAILFRRNIGAEISLFSGIDSIPQPAAE
jgi:hypothetical protein